MRNEVLKYQNELNQIPLRGFKKSELNLFMAICWYAKEKGTDEVTIPYDELINLANIKPKSQAEGAEMIENISKKLLQIAIIEYDTDEESGFFNLFSDYGVKKSDYTLRFSINSKYTSWFNELLKNYTTFALEDYTEFDSTYTKECFRRLKQFRPTGFWKVSLDKFRKLLDIPSKYSISKIDERVLNPIKKELGEYYNYFEIKKVYDSKKKGRPRVVGLEFYFDKEAVEFAVEDKYNELKQFSPPNIEHVPAQYPKLKKAKEGESVTNIPDWAKKESKTVATPREKEELERLKAEMQED